MFVLTFTIRDYDDCTVEVLAVSEDKNRLQTFADEHADNIEKFMAMDGVQDELMAKYLLEHLESRPKPPSRVRPPKLPCDQRLITVVMRDERKQIEADNKKREDEYSGLYDIWAGQQKAEVKKQMSQLFNVDDLEWFERMAAVQDNPEKGMYDIVEIQVI